MSEQVIEAYWAWSFARSFQITPDVQLYLNPALKEKKQLAAAYSLRAAVLL
ncbi:MAG: carbohydrate porin [Legionella sp.]